MSNGPVVNQPEASYAFAETSSSSSADEKELQAVLLKPDKLPTQSVRLDQPNCSFRHMTVCHCLATVPDTDQLQEALQRVLNKNPILAGRLRPTLSSQGAARPDGLEIAFDGPVGIHFQVRPLSADMEHQVERLDAERYARQFLHIHTEFAESLGVARVGYGLNLLGRDRPLCMASYCPGAQVSVLALSVSRILGDFALQTLFRSWDEEFQDPSSTTSNAAGGREVVRMLYRPILALQAIHKALDGVWSWLYETTISQFTNCCTTRGDSGGRHLMAETSLKETDKAQADADCDSAPEDREFYAIAVRVREETLSSIRAAAAASAPAGGIGITSVFISDALYAWLGNVLRLPQALPFLADRDRFSTGSTTASENEQLEDVQLEDMQESQPPKAPPRVNSLPRIENVAGDKEMGLQCQVLKLRLRPFHYRGSLAADLKRLQREALDSTESCGVARACRISGGIKAGLAPQIAVTSCVWRCGRTSGIGGYPCRRAGEVRG
eukprot:s3_g17.t1